MSLKSYRDIPTPFPGRFTGNQVFTGSWKTYKPLINTSKCTLCGLCQIYCPEACIYMEDKVIIDYDYCKGCGICENECPTKAIIMEKEG